MKIDFQQLNNKNFTIHSLDDFIRRQKVQECWRVVNNRWKLVPITFEEKRTVAECREIAKDIASHIEKDQTAFGGRKTIYFRTLVERKSGGI